MLIISPLPQHYVESYLIVQSDAVCSLISSALVPYDVCLDGAYNVRLSAANDTLMVVRRKITLR